MERGGIIVNLRHYKRIFLKLASGVMSAEARKAADAFAAHKRAHPGTVPYDELTPLQKRMQDGAV